jgi:hypothetical protein
LPNPREAVLTLKELSMLQMGDRILKIPLVENKGSKLCPVTAYMNMCKLIPAEGNSLAFLKRNELRQ